MERLSRRKILGAAGAFAGGSALAGAAVAGAPSNADAELFALLAEEERLWELVSRLQDEAQRREEAIPEGRVEIGRETINGKTEPIYATTEEDLAQQFDRPPLSGKFAEAYRILGIQTVLYLDRRDELASIIRDQATARAEARRIARVDELEAEAKQYVERVLDLSAKIDQMRPQTIEGAIAMLDHDIPDRVEGAIAGLREIARQGTRA
jgi:hypothetical protein